MPSEKMPTVKFSSFENFIVKIEKHENPRQMPFLSYFAASHDQQDTVNDFIKEDLEKVLQESSMDKELVSINPTRTFLKGAWSRDSFLYFNGVYFPFRWIDCNGNNRPEREAYVLKTGLAVGEMDFPGIDSEKVYRRMFTDREASMFSIGEGGLYYPDHDNNTLFISNGVVVENGIYSMKEHYQQIKDLHHAIFGKDINIIIFPCPENTPHIDTHLTVIPKTKTLLIDHNYCYEVQEAGCIEELQQLGYKIVVVPPSRINCPLNILYLENAKGEVGAYMNPAVSKEVKQLLLEHGIKSYDISSEVADGLDNSVGGVRCITNELYTNKPEFLKKLGLA